MTANVPRERCLQLSIDTARILNAVVVGMECSDTSLFNLDVALDSMYPYDPRMMEAALMLLAALFDERGTLPGEVWERIPGVMAQIALQDLQ